MSSKETTSPAETVTDHHTAAAEWHEKAASQHREAAKLQAAGDHEKAGEYTKHAREFGVQAMHYGSKCGKENGPGAKGANGNSKGMAVASSLERADLPSVR